MRSSPGADATRQRTAHAESQAALETFRSSGPDTEQRRAMLTVSVQEYDIADVRVGCRT